MAKIQSQLYGISKSILDAEYKDLSNEHAEAERKKLYDQLEETFIYKSFHFFSNFFQHIINFGSVLTLSGLAITAISSFTVLPPAAVVLGLPLFTLGVSTILLAPAGLIISYVAYKIKDRFLNNKLNKAIEEYKEKDNTYTIRHKVSISYQRPDKVCDNLKKNTPHLAEILSVAYTILDNESYNSYMKATYLNYFATWLKINLKEIVITFADELNFQKVIKDGENDQILIKLYPNLSSQIYAIPLVERLMEAFNKAYPPVALSNIVNIHKYVSNIDRVSIKDGKIGIILHDNTKFNEKKEEYIKAAIDKKMAKRDISLKENNDNIISLLFPLKKEHFCKEELNYRIIGKFTRSVIRKQIEIKGEMIIG